MKGKPLHAVRHPPESLAHFIEIANLVPPDYEFPDLSEGLEARILEAVRRDDIEEAKRIFNDEVKERLPDLPGAFLDYLNVVVRMGFAGVYEFDFYDPPLRYRKVKQWREKLRIIAREAIRLQDLKSRPAPDNLKGDGNWSWTLPLQPDRQYKIANDGRIQVQSDVFDAAIIDVEASRIRECAICNRIFWAKKSGSKACSNKCANALRVRLYRERYQERYKPQRMNSETKEASSEGKAKKHTAKNSQQKQASSLRKRR